MDFSSYNGCHCSIVTRIYDWCNGVDTEGPAVKVSVPKGFNRYYIKFKGCIEYLKTTRYKTDGIIIGSGATYRNRIAAPHRRNICCGTEHRRCQQDGFRFTQLKTSIGCRERRVDGRQEFHLVICCDCQRCLVYRKGSGNTNCSVHPIASL